MEFRWHYAFLNNIFALWQDVCQLKSPAAAWVSALDWLNTTCSSSVWACSLSQGKICTNYNAENNTSHQTYMAPQKVPTWPITGVFPWFTPLISRERRMGSEGEEVQWKQTNLQQKCGLTGTQAPLQDRIIKDLMDLLMTVLLSAFHFSLKWHHVEGFE